MALTSVLDPADPRHGTNNAYGNLGCRCEPCRAAHRDYEHTDHARARHERHRRRMGQKPQVYGRTFVCGTRYSYVHARCRCVLCVEAERAYRADLRARQGSVPRGTARTPT